VGGAPRRHGLSELPHHGQKAKRARDTTDEEERNMHRAKRASIYSKMASRCFVIVDYPDDESNLSDDNIVEEE
jgi:hypothetical protein